MAHDAPTALNLPMVDPLPEDTQKYFDVCQEKLGWCRMCCKPMPLTSTS